MFVNELAEPVIVLAVFVNGVSDRLRFRYLESFCDGDLSAFNNPRKDCLSRVLEKIV